jgi:dTDP-4-amino-4,6-dideoxygalactose transaminase
VKQELAITGGKRIVPERLKVKWPVITESDKKAVMGVLDRGVLWGAYGPEAVGLQEDFARYTGTEYCIAVNSGTAALHMAVAAAGIGPGDEVITSAFSFAASAVAVLHHNAVPIFVDIEPTTYNINVKEIEEKINRRTKAIIPVHIHGVPCDMDEIMEIARKNNLIVIEDAAQAHGSTYKGEKVGNFGDMAIFSLNSTKNLAGGEGGLFVTDSEEYRGKANMIRMFGEFLRPDQGRKYMAYTMGWNYRTQELPAAFARSQLKRLDKYNTAAVENGKYLSRQLEGIEGVTPPYVPVDRTTIYHKYRIRLDPSRLRIDLNGARLRDAVMAALKAEGVDVVLWQTVPVPGQPLFQLKQGYGRGCPWNCAHYQGEADYDVGEYPETVKLLENSLVICSELHPIYAQPLELIKYYGEALHKIFENIEKVAEKAGSLESRESIEGTAEIG